MDKLKRYLGLASAIALLCAALTWGIGSRLDERLRTLTPLGSTGPTRLVAEHPKARFWAKATLFYNYLDSGKYLSSRAIFWSSGAETLDYLIKLLDEHPAELRSYDTGLASHLTTYRVATESRKRLESAQHMIASLSREKIAWEQQEAKWGRQREVNGVSLSAAKGADKPSPFKSSLATAERDLIEAMDAADSVLGSNVERGEHWDQAYEEAFRAHLRKLEPRFAPALKTHLDRMRTGLVGAIYAAHALLLLLVVLMIWQRQRVGAAITWPFMAFVTAAKASLRAAKRLHEKI